MTDRTSNETSDAAPDLKDRKTEPDQGESVPDQPPHDLDKLKKKAAERDEYLDLLQRVRADYANYQKRVQKERETERRYAVAPLVADLVGVLDNLERALEAATQDGNSSGLLDGIRMVHQQFGDVLSRHGVKEIEAQGEAFDPNFHEAMLEQPCDDHPPGTVTSEFQKGYLLHDRVVRPTKVAVAKAMPQPDPGAGDDDPGTKAVPDSTNE